MIHKLIYLIILAVGIFLYYNNTEPYLPVLEQGMFYYSVLALIKHRSLLKDCKYLGYTINDYRIPTLYYKGPNDIYKIEYKNNNNRCIYT